MGPRSRSEARSGVIRMIADELTIFAWYFARWLAAGRWTPVGWHQSELTTCYREPNRRSDRAAEDRREQRWHGVAYLPLDRETCRSGTGILPESAMYHYVVRKCLQAAELPHREETVAPVERPT